MREQNDPDNIIIVLISSNFVEMTVENFVLCKSHIGGVKYHQYLLLYLPKIATKLYGPARCKEDVLLSFQLAGLGKIFVLRFICWQYCINYRNFISFPSVKFCGNIQFPQSFGWISQNSAETIRFSQNFRIRELVEITVFNAVQSVTSKQIYVQS